jgi:hypothetical protein
MTYRSMMMYLLLPEQYRHVVVDGAMYYAYVFRGDMQSANATLSKFEQGLKQYEIA